MKTARQRADTSYVCIPQNAFVRLMCLESVLNLPAMQEFNNMISKNLSADADQIRPQNFFDAFMHVKGAFA